jgi:hypothetical protein
VGAIGEGGRIQPPGPFGKQMIGVWGHHDRIGEEIIDRAQSGGIAIAHPGDRHRGRAAGKDAQAIAGGVSGQIDQDIDAIGTDALGQFVIAQSRRRYPAIDQATITQGLCI